MAINDDLRSAKEEMEALNDALVGIEANFNAAISAQKGFNNAAKRVANTYKNDLSNATKVFKDSNLEILEIQKKQYNGTKLSKTEQNKLARLEAKRSKARSLAEQAINNLRKEGINIGAEDTINYLESLEASEALAESGKELVKNGILRRGLTGSILENAKEYLIQLDKSGIAAIALNKELNTSQKLSLAGEAAIMALAKGALQASSNAANLAKETGISSKSAYALQRDFANVAINTDKAFINSQRLNESFRDLVKETGLLSTYGGDTLTTMTTLTKQLGLGTKEASQLSLLARTQSTDTESVLENTVSTVNAVNRQRKSAISAKAVLNDIATASKSIVVSLGMSPEILGEAATEARALGTTLEGVDKIASSLLDFESSISKELEAELLLGKEINFEQARLYALNNDMVGLTREIANNSALTESFATGNRIQQEAAAAALGMSREDLANMVYQQELLSLGQDAFIDKYGEQTYQQMQSQSAAEKFQSAMEKIQSIIGDMAITFAPIIDMVASLADNTWLAYSAMALIAGLSLTKTIMSLMAMTAQITGSAIAASTMNSALTFGLGALAVVAAVAAISSAMNSESNKAKSQNVQDGIAPSGNGPFTITDAYGRTAVTAKGDGVAVSPNINQGGNDGEMVSLLRQIAAKDTTLNMDGRKLNDSMNTSTVSYSIGI